MRRIGVAGWLVLLTVWARCESGEPTAPIHSPLPEVIGSSLFGVGRDGFTCVAHVASKVAATEAATRLYAYLRAGSATNDTQTRTEEMRERDRAALALAHICIPTLVRLHIAPSDDDATRDRKIDEFLSQHDRLWNVGNAVNEVLPKPWKIIWVWHSPERESHGVSLPETVRFGLIGGLRQSYANTYDVGIYVFMGTNVAAHTQAYNRVEEAAFIGRTTKMQIYIKGSDKGRWPTMKTDILKALQEAERVRAGPQFPPVGGRYGWPGVLFLSPDP